MKYMLLTSLALISSMVSADQQEENLQALAKQYQVNQVVLSDYVNSYNFKCPNEVTKPQLTGLLTRLDEDTELSVMLESDEMKWRDLYVEARSLIACFGEGKISSSY